MEKLFKSALFGGYRKKAVISYISELGVKTQNEIDALEDENEELKKEVARLKEKCAELEKNSKWVGEAIISAETKAKEIVEAATAEAVKQKEAIEKKVKEDLINNTPKPNGGDGNKTMTKDEFFKLDYASQVEYKEKNPEMYKKIME